MHELAAIATTKTATGNHHPIIEVITHQTDIGTAAVEATLPRLAHSSYSHADHPVRADFDARTHLRT